MQVRSCLTSVAAVAAAALVLAGPASAATSAIPLPTGFGPESLTGHGSTLYSGSSTTGAVWTADTRTGRSRVLVPARDGRAAFGTAVAGNLLVVAGGPSGNLYVYDRRTGADVRTIALGGKLVNDVVVRNGVAYATDTMQPVVYQVALNGSAPPRAIPLSGYPTAAGDPGADGLVLDGASLILGDIGSSGLVRVDPATGASAPIALGGATSGRVTADQQIAAAITDVAKAGGRLWYMDAAFQQTPDPTAQAVVRPVPKALS